MIKMKNKKKLYTEEIQAYMKVRKTWGPLDPRTRYKPNDKIYQRAKAKSSWKKEYV